MDPRIAFELGPLKVHWYGIVITLGMIIAAFIASLEFKRKGMASCERGERSSITT